MYEDIDSPFEAAFESQDWILSMEDVVMSRFAETLAKETGFIKDNS